MKKFKAAPAKEASEQTNLIAWANLQAKTMPELARLFAVPNGGSRHMLEAVSLKRQGVKKGVPDLCLPVPRHGRHGLYIEMKRISGGIVSKEQKDWIAYLNSQGYVAVVCKGFEEARQAILDYLKPPCTYSPDII